jgi:hypothetical protein
MMGVEPLLDTLVSSLVAARSVGLVLLEAIVLYIGYGALERLVGPSVARALRGD